MANTLLQKAIPKNIKVLYRVPDEACLVEDTGLSFL